MVIMGMKNSPITLTFDSSGRMTYSFTLMGADWPRICDSSPAALK